MKYFIIFNPGARDGRSRRYLHAIKDYFSDHDLDYCIRITKKLEDAYHFSSYANKHGYHIIIGAGGDGTINKVLNGFYNKSGKRISGAKLGIIYTGTSPDFCKSYNIPYKDIRDSLHTIKQGNSRKIRIGKIVLAEQFNPFIKKVIKNSTGFITRYFGCCVNIGLGAALARYANKGIRKLLGDTFGTFLSLLKTLLVYRPQDMTCYINGMKQNIENVYNISVGKTYYIASGIKVKHSLTQDDTRFYNLIVKNLSLVSFPLCIKNIYSGDEITNNNTVSLSYSSAIEFESIHKSVEVEFDGDPQGFLPCSIEKAEDTLDLLTGGCNG